MKKVSGFFCCILFMGTLQAQIIHVPGDYPTIQSGINAATPGDTILVAEGTYFEQINFLGKKPLVVASQYFLDGDSSHIMNTIIDGSQITKPDSASVVYFLSGEDTTSVICGFTIRGGKGTGTDFYGALKLCGGGIYLTQSGATIRNNYIHDNELNDTLSTIYDGCLGAGIHISFAYPNWIIIENNRVALNRAISNKWQADGGGLYVYICHAKVRNNRIDHNIVKNIGSTGIVNTGGLIMGGDVDQPMEAIVTGNIIEYNEARAVVYGWGAGAALYNMTDNSVIRNNMFYRNKCDWTGGALDVMSWTDPENRLIDGNFFIENEAMNGAAISLDFDTLTRLTLVNNVFAGNVAHNQGGAIWFACGKQFVDTSMLVVINNTFSNNSADSVGGAIYTLIDNPLIFNSIFWENSDLHGNVVTADAGTMEIAYSDIDTNKIEGAHKVGANVFHLDPLFTSSGTFMTEHWSPCVDHGTGQYTSTKGVLYVSPETDKLGNARPVGAGYDMGAYDIQKWGMAVGKNDHTLNLRSYPNPFSLETNIECNVEVPGFITISIFNEIGTLFAQPVNTFVPAGIYRASWNSGNLPAGVYYCQIKTASCIEILKLLKY